MSYPFTTVPLNGASTLHVPVHPPLSSEKEVTVAGGGLGGGGGRGGGAGAALVKPYLAARYCCMENRSDGDSARLQEMYSATPKVLVWFQK